MASARAPADGPPEVAAGPTADPGVEEYPDLNLRQLRLRASEPRPVEDSALPPRHLDEERFPESLIDRTRIVSGGPPADGIPSIGDPRFEPASDVEWREDDEAVLALELGATVRAYPVRVMMWHEIVNDRIDGTPVAVTYCPLFELRGEWIVDAETGSTWDLFGRAVDGSLAGHQLEPITHLDTFWFAWAAYRPGTRLLVEEGHQPGRPAPPEVAARPTDGVAGRYRGQRSGPDRAQLLDRRRAPRFQRR